MLGLLAIGVEPAERHFQFVDNGAESCEETGAFLLIAVTDVDVSAILCHDCNVQVKLVEARVIRG